MEKFIELFANLFDETDINVFTPQTRFKELEEWSSLIALSVILMRNTESLSKEKTLKMSVRSKNYSIQSKVKNKIR